MNAAFPLFAPRLSAPAVRVPPVDAPRDNPRPTPRTLEQCAGMQRSSVAQVVPKEPDTPMHPADRIVVAGGAVGLLALVVMGLAGWL